MVNDDSEFDDEDGEDLLVLRRVIRGPGMPTYAGPDRPREAGGER